MMRWIFNAFLFVLLIAAGIVAWSIHQQKLSELQKIKDASHAVDAIQSEINARSALENSPLNEFGFPPSIEAAWFVEGLPYNPLVDHERPWLEIATGDALFKHHPKDPVLRNRTSAEFWYNPRRGIVRARVPQMPSDRMSLQIYNQVNGTTLSDLWHSSPPSKETDAVSSQGTIQEGKRPFRRWSVVNDGN